MNIETIKTASGGSEVIPSAQQEALTITGDAGRQDYRYGGVDTTDSAAGADIITIAMAGIWRLM